MKAENGPPAHTSIDGTRRAEPVPPPIPTPVPGTRLRAEGHNIKDEDAGLVVRSAEGDLGEAQEVGGHPRGHLLIPGQIGCGGFRWWRGSVRSAG